MQCYARGDIDKGGHSEKLERLIVLHSDVHEKKQRVNRSCRLAEFHYILF